LKFEPARLERFIDGIMSEYPKLDADSFKRRIIGAVSARTEYPASAITDQIVNEALGNIDEDEPDWTYVASKVYLRKLYREAAKNRAYDAGERYGDFYGLIKVLSTKGVYSPKTLEMYSKDEINELGTEIDPDKDALFTYIGLRTLADRYLATDNQYNVYELPQERFMLIAMTVNRNEPKEKRLALVKESYWALSNLYMTVATPTLSNSGLSFGQLSSCFIDTVDDSLQSIFDSNTDVANLSKDGGGIGQVA
jgi:ribonucleoside-diphosphate reductase alpha chain